MTYNHHIVGPFARMDPSYFGTPKEEPMRYAYKATDGREVILTPPEGVSRPEAVYMALGLVGGTEQFLLVGEVEEWDDEPDDVVVSSGASIPEPDDDKYRVLDTRHYNMVALEDKLNGLHHDGWWLKSHEGDYIIMERDVER